MNIAILHSCALSAARCWSLDPSPQTAKGLRRKYTRAQVPTGLRFQAVLSWRPCVTIASLQFLTHQNGQDRAIPQKGLWCDNACRGPSRVGCLLPLYSVLSEIPSSHNADQLVFCVSKWGTPRLLAGPAKLRLGIRGAAQSQVICQACSGCCELE